MVGLNLLAPRRPRIRIRFTTVDTVALLSLAAIYLIVYGLFHDRLNQPERELAAWLLFAFWMTIFIGVVVIAIVREIE